MTRALIVDDDEHILLFLSTVLKSIKYEVAQASNALEGFALLDGGTEFDILITDLLMPIIDGTGFVVLVRQQRPKLPIVVISAHLPDGDIDQAFPQDIVVLHKPLGYQQVIDGVKQALGIV